jgi:hypothetical protein
MNLRPLLLDYRPIGGTIGEQPAPASMAWIYPSLTFHGARVQAPPATATAARLRSLKPVRTRRTPMRAIVTIFSVLFASGCAPAGIWRRFGFGRKPGE